MEEQSKPPETTISSESPQSSSSTLPPGCRFYPSEEELLSHYLSRKINNPTTSNKEEVIKDIVGFYNYKPYDLPESSCFRFGYRGLRRHWYFFTTVEDRERKLRRAGGGVWKEKGRVKDVFSCGRKVLLGRRKCFCFYLDSCNKSGSNKFVKTQWFLYEYALFGNLKGSFVVCRMFIKSQHPNSVSEYGMGSCAEESFATVRHVGIQHDGSTLSVADIDDTHGPDYVNEKPAIEPRQLAGGTQQNNLATSQGLTGCTNMFDSKINAHLVSTIVEGDFLELDDLV